MRVIAIRVAPNYLLNKSPNKATYTGIGGNPTYEMRSYTTPPPRFVYPDLWGRGGGKRAG